MRRIFGTTLYSRIIVEFNASYHGRNKLII